MATREETMTNRQRVEALLNREKPDRVPIYPFGMGFSVVYCEAFLADVYNNPEVSLAAQRKAAEDFDWVFVPDIAYAAFADWEFGGVGPTRWQIISIINLGPIGRRTVHRHLGRQRLKINSFLTFHINSN